MFADIPSIKKLTLVNSDCGYESPKNVAWRLEELNINIPEDEDDTDCKKFLESQKSTLKVLRHNLSEKLCNFVMHNLPDLEVLHLRIRDDEQFCDEIKANEKLKSLSLTRLPEDKDKVLEKVLRHYKNIQYLKISPFGDGSDDGLDGWYNGDLAPKNVELLNLTHLSLNGLVGNFLLDVKNAESKVPGN